MPTVLRIDGYRFFFFSDEHLPKHIHVEKAEMYLRIDLESMRVTDSYRISSKEIKKVLALTQTHRELFIGAWNEYFDTDSKN
ncbi:MAG: DUF4160 domain-containing protein [Sulfurovum sp.]|nr:DUF4160 domain-containing protein [Sulfurovum sp.]